VWRGRAHVLREFGPLARQTRETFGGSQLVSSVHEVRRMLNKSDELKDRVEARKHELLAKFNDLKADTRKEAAAARSKLETKLGELELHLKTGWDNVSDAVKAKLDKWLEPDDK
jgi:hypothetical protein